MLDRSLSKQSYKQSYIGQLALYVFQVSRKGIHVFYGKPNANVLQADTN